MMEIAGRVIVMLALVVATAAGDASARTIKRVCRDGPVFSMQEAVGW